MAVRRAKGKVLLSLPIAAGEGKTIRPWLRKALGNRAQISFDNSAKLWIVARRHLRPTRDAIVAKYGLCDVEIENRISQKVQCDERCQKATGPDCVCECGGEFHGEEDISRWWVHVGETTLVSKTTETAIVRRRYVRPDLVEAWGYNEWRPGVNLPS
jgi:hypothetical protein